MTHDSRNGVSRRTFLRVSVLCASALGGVGAVSALATPSAAHAAAAKPPSTPAEPEAIRLDGNPRFQFQPVTPVPGQLQLGSLEDVWASPKYATYTDCVVSYVGGGDFVLTAEEQAVVDVVAGAGGDVSNPQLTYLTVVAASTRMDPHRLDDRLAELGAPVIRGALALAPLAPQAVLFQKWLTANG